jgi:transmembrane sensor
MNEPEIKRFLEKFVENTHTEEEHLHFLDFIRSAPIETTEGIADQYINLIEKRHGQRSSRIDIIAHIEEALDQNELDAVSERSRGRVLTGVFGKLAAAAVVLGLLVTGYWFFKKPGPAKPGDQTIAKVANDVEAPKGVKAMITLADGRRISLDSLNSGMLVMQGGVEVVKNADGEIVYKTASGDLAEVQYNTLHNPRGSKAINLTLSDGSKVWLNAGSSLTYPTAFIGSERAVEMSGEGYFEITHNEAMPFKVRKNDVAVEVLGTKFNVHAFDDGEAVIITLLDGSVKTAVAGGEEVILKPEQQARFDQNKKMTLKDHVDVEEVVAWKNGRFEFHDASIQTIMKEVSRWYDAEVVYEDKIQGHFVITGLSREVQVSKLLQTLEFTERVHFTIEGKKIIVRK